MANNVGKNLSKSSCECSQDINENVSENIDENLFKIKEVATTIGESVHTLRRWVRDFDSYIPYHLCDNGYKLFDKEAIEVLLKIKQMIRKQGYSTRQVEHYFATGGQEFVVATLYDTIEKDELKKELNDIKEMLQKQNEFNQALIDRLDQQQQYIEQSLLERDKKLTETLRLLHATKKQEEEQPKKPRGLFGFLKKRS
ncbi:MerR family transcriptional regulator [Paenibacillus larvae]